MFFLSLETSTVAFRSVLDALLSFFFTLNLTSFRYFFRNLSFLLSCLLFGENLPRKFPRNSREIGRFLREFVSSNPAKFHFFTRELSEALCSLNSSLSLKTKYDATSFSHTSAKPSRSHAQTSGHIARSRPLPNKIVRTSLPTSVIFVRRKHGGR